MATGPRVCVCSDYTAMRNDRLEMRRGQNKDVRYRSTKTSSWSVRNAEDRHSRPTHDLEGPTHGKSGREGQVVAWEVVKSCE